MRVLVACEFSGRVRNAFAALGHDAWSCDILGTESAGQHLQCDVRDLDLSVFDLMIAHPPCRYLCASGSNLWPKRQTEQQAAIEFVKFLLDAPVHKIALENPVGILTKIVGKPAQIIEPWWFGHPHTKATCLWLKNLRILLPTDICDGPWDTGVNRAGETKDRWKRRSRTYWGIAHAMADQWGRPHG